MIDIQTAIDAFGTQRKLAAALGVQTTTLNGWVKRGGIPRWHQSAVDAAYAKRIAALTLPPSASVCSDAPTAPAVADVTAGASSGD